MLLNLPDLSVTLSPRLFDASLQILHPVHQHLTPFDWRSEPILGTRGAAGLISALIAFFHMATSRKPNREGAVTYLRRCSSSGRVRLWTPWIISGLISLLSRSRSLNVCLDFSALSPGSAEPAVDHGDDAALALMFVLGRAGGIWLL